MSANPLSHHEIMALVEPFVARGRQPDLAASERGERRLAFKTREHPGTAADPPLKESLVLDNLRPDLYRLTRTLTHPSGVEATVRAEGREPAALLDWIEQVDPHIHFPVHRGVVLARSYRVGPAPANAQVQSPGVRLMLGLCAAAVGDLRLTFDAQTGPGAPAEVRLISEREGAFDLPEDFLAVLGLRWRGLRRTKGGWRATVRIPRREPARTREAERRLARTLDHLVTTLAQSPARFHDRFRVARWFFVLRRTTAILVVAGLFALGPLILYLDIPQESVWRLLAFNMPNFLLLAVFVVREIPILRPPRIPAPLPETAWVPVTAPVQPSPASPAPTPPGPVRAPDRRGPAARTRPLIAALKRVFHRSKRS